VGSELLHAAGRTNGLTGVTKLIVVFPNFANALKNSSCCPHDAVMCFIRIWQQTAIISLYKISWLVFITEMGSVNLAVRTEYLNIIHVTLLFQSLRAMAQTFSRRPVTAETGVWSYVGPREICSGWFGNGTDLSPSSSLSPCQHYSTSAPYISSSTRCSYQKAKRRGLGTFGKTILFWKSGSISYQDTSIFLSLKGEGHTSLLVTQHLIL